MPMSSPSPFVVPQDFVITILQTANDAYVVTLPYGPTYGFEGLKECMEFVTEIFHNREKKK